MVIPARQLDGRRTSDSAQLEQEGEVQGVIKTRDSVHGDLISNQ